ncbi:bifunctional DNA primase/polymerase [Deinococcus maricopensis]|uniref:Bifunctional DNA primase/polymerase n=1 Tax=Deinococcus maricopensis (strain DSM 21211 / LMG 22137 / NRRL B-23946 / LB-34) TaxID=709986 RepID=E8U611_DEIML|nr:bifunctional DNA primase/polymerase [Deinococcus maricopensis]ADV66500.1 Bifunctional DNA primase/polymerase [Deinococcus maricopensis DSM 21211]
MSARALASALHMLGLGLVLVRINHGQKRPTYSGWGKDSLGVIRTPEDAHRELTLDGREWNVGVLLGPSGLLSLDIDRDDLAREEFAKHGLDLDAMIAVHPHPTQAKGKKLWYRLPDDLDLPGVRAFQLPNPDNVDPITGQPRPMTIFELRASPRDGSKSVQDAAPGSLHPEPEYRHGDAHPHPRYYIWSADGAPTTREDIPEAPQALLDLYQVLRPSPDLAPRPTARRRSVIALPTRSGARANSSARYAAWARQHVNLCEIMARYRAVDSSGQCKCTHPDHPDAQGSMHVWRDHATCFGTKCRRNDGRRHTEDAISVTMRFEGLTFLEAVAHLNGGNLPTEEQLPTEWDEPVREEALDAARVRNAQTDWTALVDAAHRALLDQGSDQALQVMDYLYSRGFTDETILAAKLGVVDTSVPDSLLPLNSKGAPSRTWRGRLVIPNLRPDGTAMDVAGRTMQPKPTDSRKARWYRKYAIPTRPGGYGVPPYGLAQLSRRPVLVVEGQLDALSVRQALPTSNVLGIAGIGNLNPEHVSGLAGHRAYLLLDPDTDHDAGGAAARSAIDALHAAGAEVYLVPKLVSTTDDLNDCLVGMGQDDFAELLTTCVKAAQHLPAPRPAAAQLLAQPQRRRWI